MKREKVNNSHLNFYLSSTYLERLNWLKQAHTYVRKIMEIRKCKKNYRL